MKTVAVAITCLLLAATAAQAKAGSSGLDLFAGTCVAAAPTFDTVDHRAVALGAKTAEAPDRSLHAMISVTDEKAWSIDVPSERLRAMIVVAHGEVAGKNARSCFVMLKGATVSVDDVEKAFPPLQTPLQSTHVYYGWKHLWDVRLNGRPATIAAISADNNRAQSSVITLVFVNPD